MNSVNQYETIQSQEVKIVDEVVPQKGAPKISIFSPSKSRHQTFTVYADLPLDHFLQISHQMHQN